MAPTKRKSGHFPADHDNKTPESKHVRRSAPTDDAGDAVHGASRVTRSRNKPTANGMEPPAPKPEKEEATKVKGNAKAIAPSKAKTKPEPNEEEENPKKRDKKTLKASRPRKKAPEQSPEAPKRRPNNASATAPATGTTDQGKPQEEDRPYYWLMKAEPEPRLEKGVDVSFSIDDLERATEPEPWDGVRNYVARNNMRAMKKGELAFLYHSNCKTPGVAGIMRIDQEATVDENAHDPTHPYHDPKSTPENPKWSLVHVSFVERFPTLVTLVELKRLGVAGGPLEGMQMLKQTRLSVSQVRKGEWDVICELGRRKVEEDGEE